MTIPSFTPRDFQGVPHSCPPWNTVARFRHTAQFHEATESSMAAAEAENEKALAHEVASLPKVVNSFRMVPGMCACKVPYRSSLVLHNKAAFEKDDDTNFHI